MAKSYVHTVIQGQKIKLSNLEKIIYPRSKITKAEVIQYYLDVAPLILKYIRMRPLTLIRFPDGIENEKFYAKSKPTWAPSWIKSYDIKHSDNSISYVTPDGQPSIVWLANLAALELHPMQMTVDQINNPDHFIFDLDPPEKCDFEIVKNVALALRKFLVNLGYNPFIKTSGSKGLHIFVPIHKLYTNVQMVETVKELAKRFVSRNKSICTLAINKTSRGDKILIDILRNHASHTTVAPYSLRGKYGAPISFPTHWDFLPQLSSSQDITIKNYKLHLDNHGDAWESFYTSATHLHNDTAHEININPLVEEKLKTYNAKRNFDVSPEPRHNSNLIQGNKYCIQLHEASNLHYDLRLEEGGTLLSWAIPKGLPHQIKDKRLAIKTEDHPLSYLTFEGKIPKGEYGAGHMWIFDNGEILWIKKSKDKYVFILKNINSENTYSLIKTKDNQWIIQLLKRTQSVFKLPLQPMLAQHSNEIPLGIKFIYEIKWDGIRCIVHLNDNIITLYSRSGRDITAQFPELCHSDYFKVSSGIFDGEIVSLDKEGKPIFSQVISRMHSHKKVGPNNNNSIACYLFDCVELDGKDITQESLIRRQSWLKCAVHTNKSIRISEALKDGEALFKATKKMNLEGIIAKDINSKYQLGQRSEAWIKIKHRSETMCYIAGYTKGSGNRSSLFGALHLLKKDEGFKYIGKVGTGFDVITMKNIMETLSPYVVTKKPFIEKTSDDHSSVWVKPVIKCNVRFASLSSTGTLREPVFLHLIKL